MHVAYFIGGPLDLSKRSMEGNTPMPRIRHAVIGPLPEFSPALNSFEPPFAEVVEYELRYVNERMMGRKTAVYIERGA